MATRERVQQYIKRWESRGYNHTGIPDAAPLELEAENLAPSWRQVAMCLLKNDAQLLSLGFTGTRSHWYDALKQIELKKRSKNR